MSKNHYTILAVSHTATKEEIKQAFRIQAHVYHPDKPGGNEEQFKEINEAYQILGNPEKRKQYDQNGSYSGTGFAGTGMSWETFHKQTRPEKKDETTQYDDLAIEKVIDEGIGLVDDVIHSILK